MRGGVTCAAELLESLGRDAFRRSDPTAIRGGESYAWQLHRGRSMRSGPEVLFIGSRDDPLLVALDSACHRRAVPITHVPQASLAHAWFVLDDQCLQINGRYVGGIVMRGRPDALMSESFVVEDRGFVDSEMRALLLGAMELESVLAVNQYDPQVWFQGVEWVIWRDRMRDSNVPVVPLAFGDVPAAESSRWKPFHGKRVKPPLNQAARRSMGSAMTVESPLRRAVVACGRIIDGDDHPTYRTAAEVLRARGVVLAEVSIDTEGRLCHVDTTPVEMSPRAIECASDMLSEFFDAHLRRW